MSIISVVSNHSGADDQSSRSIALFCSCGLIASFCFMAIGLDLSASWF
jgi:hypothetical protein